MQDRDAVLDAEGTDQNVDGLAHGHTFRSQQPVVRGRSFSDVETDHYKSVKGEEQGGDGRSIARRAEALHDLAIDEIADADKVALARGIGRPCRLSAAHRP